MTYLRRVLIPKLWKGAADIMDNLGAHKAADVQSLIEAVGARLLYLTTYPADLNPIKLAWSQFKDHLCWVGAHTKHALAHAIRERLARTHPAHTRAYFTHCDYRGLTIVNYTLEPFRNLKLLSCINR